MKNWMSLIMKSFLTGSALSAALLVGCGTTEDVVVEEEIENSFLENEQLGSDIGDGKADSFYVTNLKNIEVEATLEADVVVGSSYQLQKAPLDVGQFALTYLRHLPSTPIYIQSLAEDYANGADQIEWQIGTAWKKWSVLTSSERSTAKHFRLNKVNTVITNFDKITAGVKEGTSFEAVVPLKPLSLYADQARNCEGGDGHIQASPDVYWYVWDPAKSTCKATTQKAKLTVTKVFPKSTSAVYPEYDKLFADKSLDTIVFFGSVHDKNDVNDLSYTLIKNFETSIKTAGFVKGTATKGLRYTRVKNGITANVDIYTPKEFDGLNDYANKQNFFDAVKTHEVVVFNGHSVLGASDFWADPKIYQDPTKYQIFLYNGCLGYAYYVAPILNGKKSPDNVDVVSNVIETPFSIMVRETSSAVSMLLANADKLKGPSWQDILTQMNTQAKTSYGAGAYYGASAARDNKFKPKP